MGLYRCLHTKATLPVSHLSGIDQVQCFQWLPMVLKEGSLELDITKKLFTVGLNEALGQIAKRSNLEEFKTRLDEALSHLV